jgi:transposase
MRRFVEGIDRGQATLFPECLEDWIDENSPVRVIDAFVGKLDLSRLGFDGVAPEANGSTFVPPRDAAQAVQFAAPRAGAG